MRCSSFPFLFAFAVGLLSERALAQELRSRAAPVPQSNPSDLRADRPYDYSWRYYRPGNTGIQGDFNECIWIGPDSDPWIGGYDPNAQEGGIAKFVQSQNRWINVSNVDYPEIGSANDVGFVFAIDMVDDLEGNLWIGTLRGVLRMNLAAGPRSLVRFGPHNSPLPGGGTADITRAPDGTIWISAHSTAWAGGGLTRYDPATDSWTHWNTHGGDKIAAQPRPGGGYYLWASPPGYVQAPVERWDSTTGAWTSIAPVIGNPSHLISKDSVDAAGNLWIRRWLNEQNEERLDCLRPDGTWLTPPIPPANGFVSQAALRPYGDLQCLLVDGFQQLQRFDGLAWTNLGPVPHDATIDDLDIAPNGDIWLCGTGTGGALKRTASTGQWQRHRITNCSQFDLFNTDLALDPHSNRVFACANASSGVGGMVEFDGTRWKGYVNDLGHGLTGPWPSTSPQSEAVYVRPSNGRVVVNPLNDFTHEFDGTSWTRLTGGPDQVQNYVEDSSGRLWCANHYGGIGVFEAGVFRPVESGDWFNEVYRDPSRPGTVWGSLGFSLVRTDGDGYRFEVTPAAFPGVPGAHFGGLAVEPNGTAWVSLGSALAKVDPATGQAQVVFQYGVNWPFPGEYVIPVAYTPDGRLWMGYGKDYPFDDNGLLWWDGERTGSFPAPPNGEWRRGGLPHYILSDVEVRTIPNGYELWLACFSRGLAVLTVQHSTPPVRKR